MKSALQLLRQCQRPVLAGHMRADGDCLGAESVLYHTLKQLGKQVLVLNPDPPDPRYHYLYEHTPFHVYSGPQSLPDYDLLIVCDCSQLTRLGAMGEEVRQRSADRMAVDHHPLRGGDREQWTALVHDADAPASGYLALQIAQQLQVSLPLGARQAAFTALASDTGWFRYDNADSQTWNCASDMVRSGVQPAQLYREIYQQCDPGHPIGIGAALANTQYFHDNRLAITWLSQTELQKAGGTLQDTDEVLDLLRSVKSVEVAAFLFEFEPGEVKASLRSKADVNVNLLAQKLGGGGHARAAGVRFPAEKGFHECLEDMRDVLLHAFQATKHALPD